MAGRQMDAGPTGMAVAANVMRLREGQNLNYTQVAARLSQAGRPISALGVRRIEAGERRVDADDLVALSVALGVTPASLLMPDTASPDGLVEITGSAEPIEAEVVWLWLEAKRPLRWRVSPTASGGVTADGRQMTEFLLRALPSWLEELRMNPETRHPARVLVERLEALVVSALSSLSSDLEPAALRRMQTMFAGAIELEVIALQHLVEDLRAGVDIKGQVPHGDG